MGTKATLPTEKRMKNMWYALRSKIRRNPPKRGHFFRDYMTFREWYLSQYKSVPKCHYCGIPEPYVKTIYWGIRETKRPKTRIRLELDRRDPNGNYNSDNVVLACMICNNAKSDVFTEEEFLRIGIEIRSAWMNIAQEKGLSITDQ